MVDRWGQDRGWTARPLGVSGLPTFEHGPTVISSALDAIEHFPQLPADIANPQIACLAIEAHAPRIAQAVRPHFAARSWHADERVVVRDAVVLSTFGMVHVDSQDGRGQVTDVLAVLEGVGGIRRPRVARGNIEAAIGTEFST